MKSLHIGILAGEPSGDLLGAGVIRALQEQAAQQGTSIRFSGIGGPQMLAAGLESHWHMAELSVHGFVQPLLRLPRLLRLLLALERHFAADPPDVFLGVDFNVFNGLLERRLKRRGIRTAHYVSPSVYAWRRGRAQRMARKVDLLLTLFPFEPPFYAGTGVQAVCVGHPLADAIAADSNPDEARQAARVALGIAADVPVLTLLPGSRRSEVGFMAPPFLAAAELLLAQLPELVCLVPAATPELAVLLRERAAGPPGQPGHKLVPQVLDGNSRSAMAAADVVLVKSGTATLEAMLLRRPMVVAYRLGGLTHALLRRLVHTPWFALPNILANAPLVPEFIQDEVTPPILADALAAAFAARGSSAEQQLLARFDQLHRDLARDASASAAVALLQLLGHER